MLRKEILLQMLSNVIEDPSLIKDFDMHSTIKFNFNDEAIVFLSEIDDQIWVWSRLDFINSYNSKNNAYELFLLLTEKRPFIVTNQYVLSRSDSDEFELKALLNEEAISSHDNLHAVIGLFLNDYLKIKAIF